MNLTSTSRTHVGGVRRFNEDRLLDRPDLGLWAVADGMGGHSNGEEAAQTVIDALTAISPGNSGLSLLSGTEQALKQANLLIRQQNDRLAGISGATIVALLAREGHYCCLWAGDSRAYRLRDGQLCQLTHDHSLVQELIDNGLVKEEERRRHPQANVITRAMGHVDDVEIDREFGTIESGDIFLLCSDGLSNCVSEEELREFLSVKREAADILMDLALARGAPDNVSLVLVYAGVR